jgi:hypothetical protein
MKILALEIENPACAQTVNQELLREEALAVKQLMQAGWIREIYFHAEALTAVIVMEAQDRSEAEAFLFGLPLVRSGAIRFDIIPLEPYDGFNRLL